MSACEDCWNEAYMKSRMLGGTQVDWYYRLLKENTEHDAKCGGARTNCRHDFWPPMHSKACPVSKEKE